MAGSGNYRAAGRIRQRIGQRHGVGEPTHVTGNDVVPAFLGNAPALMRAPGRGGSVTASFCSGRGTHFLTPQVALLTLS